MSTTGRCPFELRAALHDRNTWVQAPADLSPLELTELTAIGPLDGSVHHRTVISPLLARPLPCSVFSAAALCDGLQIRAQCGSRPDQLAPSRRWSPLHVLRLSKHERSWPSTAETNVIGRLPDSMS